MKDNNPPCGCFLLLRRRHHHYCRSSSSSSSSADDGSAGSENKTSVVKNNFTMMIIFAKFPFQTNLLIPSSKLVINMSVYLIWCPYVIQKTTIFVVQKNNSKIHRYPRCNSTATASTVVVAASREEEASIRLIFVFYLAY